ncbi:MAG: hypothetical protein AAGJ81_16235 [Verrucomicrobiota bacterium]
MTKAQKKKEMISILYWSHLSFSDQRRLFELAGVSTSIKDVLEYHRFRRAEERIKKLNFEDFAGLSDDDLHALGELFKLRIEELFSTPQPKTGNRPIEKL